MNTGKLQRRWSEEKPEVYNKDERKVCLDIHPETGTNADGKVVNGFSYVMVEIDGQIDYGHIKSQLIESGFAQKDEFGLIMNAANDILNAMSVSNTFAEFKAALDTADVKAFADFCAFRTYCGEVSKQIIKQY